MDKLAATLPPTMNYFFHRVIESIGGGKTLGKYGLANLGQIKQTLERFYKEVVARNIPLDADSPLYNIYQEIEYPLSELIKYFQLVQSSDEPNIDSKTAHIFTFFVKEKISELKKIAYEIDGDEPDEVIQICLNPEGNDKKSNAPEEVLRTIAAGDYPMYEILEVEDGNEYICIRSIENPNNCIELPASILYVLGNALRKVYNEYFQKK